MKRELDLTDMAIIEQLRSDSRLSIRELANRVHRSATPVFERVRRLESDGVIRRYTIDVDAEALGIGFTVFCNVKLDRINADIHREFAAAINEMPQVKECYNVSGAYDYLLKVQVREMGSYREFVTEKLGRLPMVGSVQSVFAMDQIKH